MSHCPHRGSFLGGRRPRVFWWRAFSSYRPKKGVVSLGRCSGSQVVNVGDMALRG
jgi:hypothetical protein